MNYRRGQKIVVNKNLGPDGGQNRDEYYYGRSVRDYPLGSKGEIADFCQDHYKVMIKGKGSPICLTHQEIKLDEESEREREGKLSVNLEQALLETPKGEKDEEIEEILEADPVVEMPTEVVPVVRVERKKGFLEKVMGLFGYSPREESEIVEAQGIVNQNGKEIVKRRITKVDPNYSQCVGKEKPFEPKFNPKDEFPIWVKEQFPELKKYAGIIGDSESLGDYKELNERKEEVTLAAQKAWAGVEEATEGTGDYGGRHCHRKFLRPIFGKLYVAKDIKEYSTVLNKLVRALEVSGSQGFPYNGDIEDFRREYGQQ